MTLTPTPANEERIHHLMDTGEYESVDDVLSAALDRLAVDRIVHGIGFAEFQQKINAGWSSAERGNLVTPEAARAHLGRVREELRRG